MEYYVLDRKTTARMLGVSTRTLDRYIAKKMFSTKRMKGKVFFHKKEIEDFMLNKNTESVDIKPQLLSTQLNDTKNIYETGGLSKIAENMSKTVSKPLSFELEKNYEKALLREEMYKKMYEGTKKLFEDQQAQLKELCYRLGQLEEKKGINNFLLEQKNLEQQKLLITDMKQEIIRHERTNKDLRSEISSFEVMQKVYTAITITSIFILSFLYAIF